MERVILHCDMNNFYASVECKMNPSIRNLYVAVCGNTAERHGIVLAKNQKAKLRGVKTGQAIWEAKLRCPELVVVHPHFEEYLKYSRKAREIYERYTDKVEPFGMDECWLDVTDSVELFGSGEQIADMIRRSVKEELGLTISVGVSFNKIFAKLGSDLKKPDAVSVIRKQDFQNKIWDLPVEMLFGVGRATHKKLHSVGVLTIGQLAQFPRDMLLVKFGKNGGMLWNFANGLDTSRVMQADSVIPVKSVGHGITTVKDLENEKQVWCVMLELSQLIGRKLMDMHLSCKGIQIVLRDTKLQITEFQYAPDHALQSPMLIAKAAFKLFCRRYDWSNPLRSVTVRAISLQPDEQPVQCDLFGTDEMMEHQKKLDQIVERVRRKYGDDSLRNAVLLGETLMPPAKPEIIMPNGTV